MIKQEKIKKQILKIPVELLDEFIEKKLIKIPENEICKSLLPGKYSKFAAGITHEELRSAFVSFLAEKYPNNDAIKSVSLSRLPTEFTIRANISFGQVEKYRGSLFTPEGEKRPVVFLGIGIKNNVGEGDEMA